MSRVYLDWNATAPLRPEARAAMLAAMDVVGNPSSVHAEGRAARAIVERARGQVAALTGGDVDEVVFTSGATEAVNTVVTGDPVGDCPILVSSLEHDCVEASVAEQCHYRSVERIPSERSGRVAPGDLFALIKRVKSEANFAVGTGADKTSPILAIWPSASGETGVNPIGDPESTSGLEAYDTVLKDVTQEAGRLRMVPSRGPYHPGYTHLALSAHKLGGPKGVGAIVERKRFTRASVSVSPMLRGGGQEMGRRAGTENVIGVAGFGAAAEAALRDLEDGVWERVEKLRNILEDALADAEKEIIFVGKEVARLPNTSCFIAPGWKGETQVMQMDLAGYAISAGSACSSGKVKESRVLRAMGFDAVAASSAVRVSLGPTTTEDEVLGFARTWTEHYRRWKQRAA